MKLKKLSESVESKLLCEDISSLKKTASDFINDTIDSALSNIAVQLPSKVKGYDASWAATDGSDAAEATKAQTALVKAVTDLLFANYSDESLTESNDDKLLMEGPLDMLKDLHNKIDPKGALKRATNALDKIPKNAEKVLAKDFDSKNKNSKFYIDHNYGKPYTQSEWIRLCNAKAGDNEFYKQRYNAIVVDEAGYIVRRGIELVNGRERFLIGSTDKLKSEYATDDYSYGSVKPKKDETPTTVDQKKDDAPQEPDVKPDNSTAPDDKKPVDDKSSKDSDSTKDADATKTGETSDDSSQQNKTKELSQKPKTVNSRKTRRLHALAALGISFLDEKNKPVDMSKNSTIDFDTMLKGKYFVKIGTTKVPFAKWYATAKQRKILEQLKLF